MVVGNLLGRKVAVIVVDGLRGGIPEIEFPCCFPLEEEVVGDKSFRFHGALVSVGRICGKVNSEFTRMGSQKSRDQGQVITGLTCGTLFYSVWIFERMPLMISGRVSSTEMTMASPGSGSSNVSNWFLRSSTGMK